MTSLSGVRSVLMKMKLAAGSFSDLRSLQLMQHGSSDSRCVPTCLN